MAMILVHIELFPFHIRQVPPPRFTSPENIDDNVETNTEDNINVTTQPKSRTIKSKKYEPSPSITVQELQVDSKKKVNHL